MKGLRGLGAALVLATLTLGSPAVLLRFGRLGGLLTLDWAKLWNLPDDGRLVLGLVTAIGWLAWAIWTLVVLVDVAGRLAGRRWRMPALGFVQGFVAALIVAVLALGRPTPSLAAPAPAPRVLILEHRSPGGSPADASSDVARFVDSQPNAETDVGARYDVQPGDDLWSIAQRLLGDGMGWREIAAANPRIDDPAHIEPGWSLVVPGWLGPDRQPGSLPDLAPPQQAGPSSTPPKPGEAPRAPTAPSDVPATDPAPAPPPTVDARRPAPATSTPASGPSSAASSSPPAAAADSATPTPATSTPAAPGTPGPVDAPASPVGSAATTSSGAPTQRPPSFSATPARSEELPPTGEQAGAAASATPTAGAASARESSPTDPPRGPSALQLAVGLGGLSATAILAALALQRARQHFRRELGRRAPDGAPGARRLEAILGVMDDPSGISLLETAQRSIAVHCRGRALPGVEYATLSHDSLVWHLTRPAEPPPGFSADGSAWILPRTGLTALGLPSGPLAYPALLPVGTTEDGATLLIDLEYAGVLGVCGADAAETVAALLLDAVVAPWAAERDVVATARYADLSVASEQEVGLVDDPADALAGRPLPVDWREQRLDPDRAPDLAPRLVFLDAAMQRVAVPPGTAAVMPDDAARWQLDCDAGELRIPAGTFSMRPSRLTPELRESVASLFATAAAEATDVAPWWSHAAPDLTLLPLGASVPGAPLEPETLVTDPPAPAPELLLLGAIDLIGACGEPPTRALRQCMEYAGWLLEHPGGTASQMASDLIIAEGTRRSNLSRLRAWLGSDPEGRPYLPEAYSGRLELHPLVTSDWRRLQLIAAPGVNRLRVASLTAALSLVRGAPLADAAPGQWHWAEPMRSDMVALIRDIGVQLATLALAEGDVDLVRWATARALAAAPEDELLLCARIRAEAALGNRAEVERLAWRLTQHARSLGVELREDTVLLLQEAVEGHVRARAVG